jgi:hypothetical protein
LYAVCFRGERSAGFVREENRGSLESQAFNVLWYRKIRGLDNGIVVDRDDIVVGTGWKREEEMTRNGIGLAGLLGETEAVDWLIQLGLAGSAGYALGGDAGLAHTWLGPRLGRSFL